MGLIDKILGRKPKKNLQATPFQTFTEYSPVFTSFDGGVYEMELTRTAVDRFATACSKLKPEIRGSALPKINRAIASSPNDYDTWPAFLARCATILECKTTLAIVPSYASDLRTITGVYPMVFEYAEVLDYMDEAWVRFTYADGTNASLPLVDVCLITKFQYESEFFGGGNNLKTTMQLIHSQAEAQEAAIKNGATIRFIGSLNGMVREEDIEKKRKRFVESNLSAENTSGLMLYDSTFNNIRQVEPQHYTIDAAEMERINSNVYTYFGTNKKILQNDYDEESWDAYYEGKVEPFAVKLGAGLTHMLYTPVQQMHGNCISFSSNRLEYASNASKRNMIADMVDRGIITLNEAREILQLPPMADGDVRVIRGEYINLNALDAHSIMASNEIGMADSTLELYEEDRDDKRVDEDEADLEHNDHDKGR